jgi:DNA-binding CsgD family transcriptional regulator
MTDRFRARPRSPAEGLLPPDGLEARRFTIEGDDYVLFEFPLPGIDLPSGLTPAERDVARRTIEGQSKGEIARARKTSVHTVTNQLRSIYQKLRISSRPELVRVCRAKPVASRS